MRCGPSSREGLVIVRVTLLNQFYAPDISPTAQLAASLAEHRAAQGDTVTVIAGRAGYLEGLSVAPPHDAPANLRLRRVWTPDLGRASVPRRLLGYVAFFAGSVLRMVLLPRQDVIIAMTTPPFVVVVALLHKVLHPRTRVVLWSMDCYPDAAERFGELARGGFTSRVLRGVNRAVFKRLAHLVCLDRAMADLLTSQYAAGHGRPPASIIPNWERADLFPPGAQVATWPGYEQLGVGDRITVVYLGNTGVGHQFGTVLDAAAELAHDAAFVFIGGGARRQALERSVDERGLSNVLFHGYVPKEDTPAVMAGADGALITLDERSLGVMSPSKLHANLAAGLPVLYVGPTGSNVDEAIERFDCGASLREGDVSGLVAAVRSLRDNDARRSRARAAFDEAYCDTATLPRFDEVLGQEPG